VNARTVIGILGVVGAVAACGAAARSSHAPSVEPAPAPSVEPASAPAPAPVPVPAPAPAPTEPAGPPAKSLAFASKAPAGSSGACRVPPNADAGYPESPTAVAGCPDVYELSRSDGIDVGDHLPTVKPTEMPEWSLDALRDFACAYACAPVGSAAHLLAWNVIQDQRPLRNHNAVFAIEHATVPPRVKWSVVVMYRHATNTWWNIAVSFHSRARPIRNFSHAPTAAETLALLDENGFQLAAENDGFHVLAGNVIDPLWKLVTGEAPTRFFPPGIER